MTESDSAGGPSLLCRVGGGGETVASIPTGSDSRSPIVARPDLRGIARSVGARSGPFRQGRRGARRASGGFLGAVRARSQRGGRRLGAIRLVGFVWSGGRLLAAPVIATLEDRADAQAARRVGGTIYASTLAKVALLQPLFHQAAEAFQDREILELDRTGNERAWDGRLSSSNLFGFFRLF